MRRIFSLLMLVPLLLLGFTVLNSQSASAYTSQIIDTFDGSTLDASKWIINNWPEGEISVNDKVVAYVSGSVESCAARLETTWKSAVDFDASVDFNIGDGWANPLIAHLDGAYLGMALEGDSYSNWIQITRISQPDDDHIGVDLSRPGDSKLAYIHIENNNEATSGNFRITRTGQQFDFFYNIGSGEMLAYSWIAPQEVSRVKIYFGANSIGSSQEFTTYFDNFRLDYEPNTVNVDYWYDYVYWFAGDNYDNTQVNGYKVWFSHIGNVNDESNEPVSNATSTLNSAYSLGYQLSDTNFDAESPYIWNFGDVPEDSSHGIWVSTGEYPALNVDFTPGYCVTRSADQTVFQSDGTQIVTISITPLEYIDELWVDFNLTDSSPLVHPTFIDQPDSMRMLRFIENSPTVGKTYTFQANIDVDLVDETGSIEFMPQVNLASRYYTDFSVFNGPSITYNPDELGDWTWSGDGYYCWNRYLHFFKSLVMQERINLIDPFINTVTPKTANRGDTLDISLKGLNFDYVDSVSFGDGINLINFSVIDSNNINAAIQIDTHALSGTRDITMTAEGELFVFPDAFLINTDVASIEFVSARNFGIDGDSFNNELVNGFKFWVSHMGNTADGSGSTMYNLTSTLDSIYNFLWQEPGAQKPNDKIYNWSFGDIPENGTYGIAVGGDWENTIFVEYHPGFTASRTVNPRVLQQNGQQIFTLDVTPKEQMDQLKIRISVNANTFITPVIIGTDATTVPVHTDSYLGPNYWDVYFYNPVVDTEYTLQAVIDIDIADGIGAVEYVPQVDISCVNSTYLSQQSSSVTCNPEQLDGLGSWTWSADGDYLWNWFYTFSKGITLNEYVNAGPLIIDSAANPNPAAVNTPVGLFAQVADSIPGNGGIESVEFSLDSGNTWQPMSIQGSGPDVNASANLGQFSQAGIYEILVRARDSAGIVGPTDTLLLAIFDPSAGFVTGGGWINSPAGAYSRDPTLVGKANFGFVSKYLKGANIPTGNTEFQFKAGDLNFKSTSYEWLVVAGSKAQFKGVGTINGEGIYKFMLFAKDGSPDTFRIKITDTSDNVIYDNQVETAISGGSIVVHTK
jgi:hypothetical protein